MEAKNDVKSKDGVRENTKHVTKVIKKTAKTKKKSELSKIANTIISEECRSLKEYAIYEVLIPVVKDTISELVKGSIDMIFYGEVRRGSSNRGGRSGTNSSKVSYRDFYDDRSGSRRISERRDDDRRRQRYSYDDIIFETREDANDVLTRMDEIVEQYGVVTVADLFDLAGISGNGYTDQNYGWTSTRSASVERNRANEYYLKLQRPSNIK